ncbi:MAG: HdeD family acid-resistance protein [Treponemataceae bacterium]
MNFTFYKFLWLVGGLFFIGCGIFIILSPVEIIATLTFLIAIAVCFSGINSILSFIRWQKEEYYSTWILADGIMSIIISVILATNKTLSVNFIPYILGFWILFSGILRMVNARHLSDFGIGRWNSIFLSGIFMSLTGIFLLINPIIIAVAVSFLLGLLFITQGLASLFMLFAFWKNYL